MGLHLTSSISRFHVSTFVKRLTGCLVGVAMLVGMDPLAGLTASLAPCLHRRDPCLYLRE
jgi:hypothetical protein